VGVGKGGGELPGEDVVGYGCDAVFISEGEAEGEHEGGFAGAYGSVGGFVSLLSFTLLLMVRVSEPVTYRADGDAGIPIGTTVVLRLTHRFPL